MQSNCVREGGEMDRRRRRDVRASNFLPNFESTWKNMDGVDSNMVLEVPDTPDRLAMRHSVGGSSKPSWGRENFRWDANPNCDPVRRTYVSRSQSSHHNSIGSSNTSNDAEFFFREANLARQLSNTAETKPSSQCHSDPLELENLRLSNGSVRCRETIDLSCKSPLSASDTTSCQDSWRGDVGFFSENKIALSPPAVEDKKMEKLYGDTTGLKYSDKGKGIDLCSDSKLRNDCISTCNAEKANISAEDGCQFFSNSINGVMCSSSTATSDRDNGKRTDLCKNSELINGQPRRRRSAQRRLVRNGCISPLNIERSRNSMKQKEVEAENNGSLSHQLHIISPDCQDKRSDKMKGKVTVEDIVASSEQSVKDRSHSNSVSLLSGKEVADISDVECGGRRFEDKGWITTRNHTRKSSTFPTWMSGSSVLKSEDASSHPLNGSHEVAMANRSSVNVIHVDPDVPALQRGIDPILLQDYQEVQSENGRINGKRKLGSSGFDGAECSSSMSNGHERPYRQPLNSRSTRSRRSQRGGLTLAPVIEVDELQSPVAISNSIGRDRQVESDEMLARQLQEELYNETAAVGNTDEIDASIALLLQENERRSASIARQHQSHRRDLSSSSTRSHFRQIPARETTRPGVPTTLAQMRRNMQRTIMDLNRRLGIREDAFGDIGDVASNNLLHIQRDFNENDYEMLLALDENNHQLGGASDRQINNLPQSIIQHEDSQEACAVCLEVPAIGDTIRHLPCLHKFHKECIDTWLRRKRSCPICKSDIR